MILQVVNSIGISCLSREHPNVSERSTDTTLYMPKIFGKYLLYEELLGKYLWYEELLGKYLWFEELLGISLV
jgi:hypothetical protein